MPVAAAVPVNSVESSPGASGPGEDFTPSYVHTSVPVMEGPVVTGGGSTPASTLKTAKGIGGGAEYADIDAGTSASLHDKPRPGLLADRLAAPPGNGYSNHKAPHPSSAYLQESSWPVYSTGSYYAQTSL